MQNKIRINSVEYADGNVHLASLYIHSGETQKGRTGENINKYSASVNII